MFSIRKIIGIGSDVLLQLGVTIQIILALFIITRYFSKDIQMTIMRKVPGKIVHYLIFLLPGTIISCGYLFVFRSDNLHFPESVFFICLGFIFYTLINKLKYPKLINNFYVSKKQHPESIEADTADSKNRLIDLFFITMKKEEKNNTCVTIAIICFVAFLKYNMVSLLFARSLMNSDFGTASAMVVILYVFVICVVLIIK